MAKLYTEENSLAPYSELSVTDTDMPGLMSKPRTFLMNCTQFGLNFMVLLLSVVVVPAQVEALVGSSAKGSCLGGLVAGGAAVTFLASPMIGMASDRLRSKFGRRRPVMLVGMAFLCVGLLGMAFSAPTLIIDMKGVDDANSTSTSAAAAGNQTDYCFRDLVAKRCLPFANDSVTSPGFTAGGGAQPGGTIMPRKNKRLKSEAILQDGAPGNIGLYVVFFLVVISSQAAISVPFNALVADKSHPSQRGFNSGVMGAMILFGNVTGAAAGLAFTHIGVLSIYGMIIAVLIVSILITVFFTSEHLGRAEEVKERLGCKIMFTSFWSPMKEHDFRWVFITRFLMQQGVATITGFLEYWLDDMLQLPGCWTAATSVALLLLPLLFSAALSSVVFGVISDRTGRRKAIVSGAAFLMGAGSLANAFLSDHAYYLAVSVAFVIGIGFGAFQSVDFALVMDVLPEEKEKAKDIAVWHQALVLPQALATPVGGLVLDLFERLNCEIGLGYIILFVITACYFTLSGAFVFKIRRAR